MSVSSHGSKYLLINNSLKVSLLNCITWQNKFLTKPYAQNYNKPGGSKMQIFG